MKFRLSIFVLLAAIVVGCDSKDDGAPVESQADGAKIIAVIPNGGKSDYWTAVQFGVDKAGKDFGWEIRWRIPPNDTDRGAQLRVINEVQAHKVAAVALAPIDRKSFVETIAEIHRDTPIILFDTGASTDAYTALIASDDRLAGRYAGERVRALLGKTGGEVAMIRCGTEFPAPTEREERFKDEMVINPNIQVVSEVVCDDDAKKAQRLTNSILEKRPNLAVIYASSEAATLGALRALEDNVRAGSVKLIGFDSDDELLAAMDRQSVDSLVVRDGVKIGETTIKAAVEAASTNRIEKNQFIEPKLITPENKKEMMQFLKPTTSPSK